MKDSKRDSITESVKNNPIYQGFQKVKVFFLGDPVINELNKVRGLLTLLYVRPQG